jgi:hypothetical protein
MGGAMKILVLIVTIVLPTFSAFGKEAQSKNSRLSRAPATQGEFQVHSGEGGGGMSFIIQGASAQKIFEYMKGAKVEKIGGTEIRCGELCCTHTPDQYFCQVDLRPNGNFRSISGD